MSQIFKDAVVNTSRSAYDAGTNGSPYSPIGQASANQRQAAHLPHHLPADWRVWKSPGIEDCAPYSLSYSDSPQRPRYSPISSAAGNSLGSQYSPEEPASSYSTANDYYSLSEYSHSTPTLSDASVLNNHQQQQNKQRQYLGTPANHLDSESHSYRPDAEIQYYEQFTSEIYSQHFEQTQGNCLQVAQSTEINENYQPDLPIANHIELVEGGQELYFSTERGSYPEENREDVFPGFIRTTGAVDKRKVPASLQHDLPQIKSSGLLVEPTDLHPLTSCVRNALKLISDICENLTANPKHQHAEEQSCIINLVRHKLADVCHTLVDDATNGQSTAQTLSLLREIAVGIERTKQQEKSFREAQAKIIGQSDDLQQSISMGLDLLKRIRQFVTGLYKPKEPESDTGEEGSGSESQSGTGRGDDQQPETINIPRKRRNQEEDPRLIKYRRVDNSFPRFIPNEPADDPIPNKSMAERERENQQQGSKRLSIFNPPVYTQHRVRNNAPYAPNPFDLSDDEEPYQSFASTGLSSKPFSSVVASGIARVTPQLSFSDAVRLGQNGFAETRVNGHNTHMGVGLRAPSRGEKSILTHEMERMEHEQYLNLINAVSQNESGTSRFAKANAQQLQSLDTQPATWSSILRGSQLRPSQQPLWPKREEGHVNRELSEYANMISREAEQQSRAPAPPPPELMQLDNINNSHASTISSSGSSSSSSSSGSSSSSSNSGSRSGSESESESSVMVAAAGSVEGKKSTVNNHSGAQKSNSVQNASTSFTEALHRRFASCVFLKDDFGDQFRSKAARRHEENEHLRALAVKEAIRSTDERRKYEEMLRENIFQYRIPHKPIFVIGGLDKKVAKKEEPQLIQLNEEHIRRYADLMQGPPQQVLITKFNLHITRDDIRTLLGTSWLNDEVINFYMCLLTKRSEERAGQVPSVYAMNTFFVPRLLQAGHSGVKRWTRKVNLFAKDIIPVPVHCNGVHWCMAIIHMRNKTIRYYDSMGKPNQNVLDALEAYLREESLDKRKQPFDTSGFVSENVPNIPQQSNGSDCGVFSCMFAEYITRDVPITFTQADMSYFRKKMALEIAGGELWM
ncbi:uncharacterized protein LOC108042976 isoform X2 [Drosophila rhopaloa]|uniref:Uncharacterized protein LOC108042976 isoform X2 n=1 Tax=Drosophila rhopaloa TaxID=1041015 RepID=A0A6P4EFR2_DRORH|nr:uncharacterized protein LOC108042976 isoform X2 [Drosophila rhopaloa]